MSDDANIEQDDRKIKRRATTYIPLPVDEDDDDGDVDDDDDYDQKRARSAGDTDLQIPEHFRPFKEENK